MVSLYKPVNTIEKKQTYRYREETSGYQWGEGNIGVGDYKGDRSYTDHVTVHALITWLIRH